MNSSYGLEKYLWERQNDCRREAQNIDLIPLRPNSTGKIGNATLTYGLRLALCVATMATLLILLAR
jgi:hypothetical protein